jgi:hypothetical protein
MVKRGRQFANRESFKGGRGRKRLCLNLPDSRICMRNALTALDRFGGVLLLKLVKILEKILLFKAHYGISF